MIFVFLVNTIVVVPFGVIGCVVRYNHLLVRDPVYQATQPTLSTVNGEAIGGTYVQRCKEAKLLSTIKPILKQILRWMQNGG